MCGWTFNRVQNSVNIFWPRAAEEGFQNPSPVRGGFWTLRGKAGLGDRRGSTTPGNLNPAGGAA